MEKLVHIKFDPETFNFLKNLDITMAKFIRSAVQEKIIRLKDNTNEDVNINNTEHLIEKVRREYELKFTKAQTVEATEDAIKYLSRDFKHFLVHSIVLIHGKKISYKTLSKKAAISLDKTKEICKKLHEYNLAEVDKYGVKSSKVIVVFRTAPNYDKKYRPIIQKFNQEIATRGKILNQRIYTRYCKPEEINQFYDKLQKLFDDLSITSSREITSQDKIYLLEFRTTDISWLKTNE